MIQNLLFGHGSGDKDGRPTQQQSMSKSTKDKTNSHPSTEKSPKTHDGKRSSLNKESTLLVPEATSLAAQVSIEGPNNAQTQKPQRQLPPFGHYTEAYTKALDILKIHPDNMATLRDILYNPAFLVEKLPDISRMTDTEFGRVRDLLCVIISHFQNRIFTANGVNKNKETISSWRGKCRADVMLESGEKNKKKAQLADAPKFKKCAFHFRLTSQGFIYLNGPHSCNPLEKSYLSYRSHLSSYMVDAGYAGGTSILWDIEQNVSENNTTSSVSSNKCAEVDKDDADIDRAWKRLKAIMAEDAYEKKRFLGYIEELTSRRQSDGTGSSGSSSGSSNGSGGGNNVDSASASQSSLSPNAKANKAKRKHRAITSSSGASSSAVPAQK
mmetsp:Transcript_11864/g.19321  ORF Transcript_11864/g.19321 Transcript_11864/m.19321 type:complete len:383 (+) Transcript_11864:64-1212(+)